ncbi:hypothetical protein GJ496_002066 [Pomphorhynchus laevis]|nr:hypothetical protein GJ496_002066 [Pomphorhynchus laevis]
MLYLILNVYLLITIGVGLTPDFPIVHTSAGSVQGKYQTVNIVDFHNNSFTRDLAVFRSIPYASPPVNELRFKAPMPFSWKGLRNVSGPAKSCMQTIDRSFNEFEGVDEWNVPSWSVISEDCLYLSIWAPINCEKCAVLVWIYGGFFTSGSIEMPVYNGGALSAYQQIIVVSINYRLGAFGFLYDGTSNAPGNAGLLDQQMALKWVKDNINNFGGDSENICLAGESAGAMSIGFHLKNRKSRSYFTHAILQSGTHIMRQAFVERIESINKTRNLAKLLNCHQRLSYVTACLRHSSAMAILNATASIDCDPFICIPFAPTKDTGNFISKTKMLRTLEERIPPVMVGVNLNEATYFLIYLIENSRLQAGNKPLNLMVNHLKINVPQFHQLFNAATMKVKLTQNGDLSSILPELCIKLNLNYTRGNFNDHSLRVLDACLSDLFLNCPTQSFAKQYYRESRLPPVIYQYLFSRRQEINHWPKWLGTMHGDEINFMMGKFIVNNEANNVFRYNKVDRKVSTILITLWGDFIKHRNVSKHYDLIWPQYNDVNQEYLEINSNPIVRRGLRYRECLLWNLIVPEIDINVLNRFSSCGDKSGSSSNLVATTIATILNIFMILFVQNFI